METLFRILRNFSKDALDVRQVFCGMKNHMDPQVASGLALNRLYNQVVCFKFSVLYTKMINFPLYFLEISPSVYAFCYKQLKTQAALDH